MVDWSDTIKEIVLQDLRNGIIKEVRKQDPLSTITFTGKDSCTIVIPQDQGDYTCFEDLENAGAAIIQMELKLHCKLPVLEATEVKELPISKLGEIISRVLAEADIEKEPDT